MTSIGFVIIWGPICFAALVAAIYLGTKLALRSYFEDDHPPSRFISIEDGNNER